jgi:ABC-2 type transport system permease protein
LVGTAIPVEYSVPIYLRFGAGLLLSAINVKYRDFSHLWDVALQALFYATPIIYPLQMIIEYNMQAAQMLMLSPLAVIFQNARAQMVGHANAVTPDQLFSNPIYIAIPYLIIALTVVLAVVYFKKNQSKFAEQV